MYKACKYLIVLLFVASCDRVDEPYPQEIYDDLFNRGFEIHGPEGVEFGSASNTFIFVKSEVENLENDSINIGWKVLDFNIPRDWELNVCDPNQCYPPDILTQNFFLHGNEIDILDAGFKPHGQAGNGYAKLMVWQIGDSADTAIEVEFFGQAE